MTSVYTKQKLKRILLMCLKLVLNSVEAGIQVDALCCIINLHLIAS